MVEFSATRVDVVHARIRSDILAGRESPGARLALAPLVARHGVSMGVVREALSRLVAQGLVESEPQRGFRIVPISPEDLRQLVKARGLVETLVLRQAIEAGGLRWESELIAAHHILSRTPWMTADDPDRLSDEWVSAHRAFHAALFRGCPNPRLVAITVPLRDSAELYQRWSVPLAGNRGISGEHRQLLDLALAGDADKACAVLATHIRRTGEVLLNNAAVVKGEEATDS
jgi:DNA-binding GntR family transcriptional regulator